jgi:hypothetical protein
VWVAERETIADVESIVCESTFGVLDVAAAGSGKVVASVARDPGSSVPGWECSTAAEVESSVFGEGSVVSDLVCSTAIEVESPISEDPGISVPGWECSTAAEVEYSVFSCEVTGDVELGCPVIVLWRPPAVGVESFVFGLSVTSVGSSVMVLRESSSADVLSTAVSMGEVVVIAACVPVLLSSADELT